MNFTPFPALATERLTLRQLKFEDQHEIFTLRSDKRVNEFLDRSKANSIEDAVNFIHKINESISNNEALYWGIAMKEDLHLIGTICLWNISKENLTAEIGYELLPDHQGKGIMQEAVAKVIEYGFEILKLNAIDAELAPGNTKSVKLLERTGFILTKAMEDTIVYSLPRK
jgi:ribosomal-protein-alanine N-acetyltransferase